MNKRTIEILNKYDKNTISLDISNKEIVGILCLNDFKKLEELNCSFNEITEIINLPYILKYLNCSNNKIVKLNIFSNIIELNYKKNLLTELYYPVNVKPKKYPSNLTHLTFGDDFNQPIDNLPNSLTHLTLGYTFNQPINNLPDSITYLKLGFEFNQPINNLPNTITHLTLGYNFNQLIDNLPSLITHLTLGNEFIQPLNNLPSTITHLTLGSEYYNIYFHNNITNLPCNLSYLKINNVLKDIKTFKMC